MSDKMPTEETLRNQLQLEWQDHIQTRSQTWKSLEIEAALVLGLIGADFKFDRVEIAIILGVLIVLSCISGIGITVHHRRGQIRKFTHIDRIEEILGLHRKGLLDTVHPPAEFRWIDIINPARNNTPLFILRMHFAILLFTVIYVGARLFLK